MEYDDSGNEALRSLYQFKLLVRKAHVAVARKAATQIYNILTSRPPEGTPVLYGVARASWHLGLNRQITDVPERKGRRSRGKIAVIPHHAPEDARTPAKPGDSFFITNAAPHLPALNEFGHSKQSPIGFVEAAVDRVAATFDDIVNQMIFNYEE